MNRRHAMTATFATLLALMLNGTAAAAIEPVLVVDITLTGACATDGFVVVVIDELDLVIFDQPISWSAAEPISIVAFGETAEPGQTQRLQLLASDHATVLFENTAWIRRPLEDGWEYHATLDCTKVPYTQLSPDTAMRTDRSQVAELPILLGIVLLLAAGLAATLVSRQFDSVVAKAWSGSRGGDQLIL